jgi:hypothetical protein
MFSVPNNDDGVWRFKIHPGHVRRQERRPPVARPEGYMTRTSAVDAAKAAIDGWLSGGVK